VSVVLQHEWMCYYAGKELVGRERRWFESEREERELLLFINDSRFNIETVSHRYLFSKGLEAMGINNNCSCSNRNCVLYQY
jgi:hypothetical protein